MERKRVTYVSGTVECEIQPPIGNRNETVLNSGPLRQLQRVYKIRGAELPGQRLLAGVCVDGENTACTNKFGGRDDAQADGSTPEDCDGRVLCMAFNNRTET